MLILEQPYRVGGEPHTAPEGKHWEGKGGDRIRLQAEQACGAAALQVHVDRRHEVSVSNTASTQHLSKQAYKQHLFVNRQHPFGNWRSQQATPFQQQAALFWQQATLFQHSGRRAYQQLILILAHVRTISCLFDSALPVP